MAVATEDGVDVGVCGETHHSISLKNRIFREVRLTQAFQSLLPLRKL